MQPEDKRYYIEKMREQNDVRKQIRRYLAALRRLRAVTLASASDRGLAPCHSSDESAIRELLRQHAHEYEDGELETRLCIPPRVPPEESCDGRCGAGRASLLIRRLSL